MTLARMVFFFLPAQRVGFVKATSMSKYFVWADVLTFIIQASGAVMTDPGSDPNTIKAGLNVYIGGLGLQEFFILCFLGMMVVFHRKLLALEATGAGATLDNSAFSGIAQKRSWRPLFYTLYAILAFISLRILYRIAEFAGGITPSNPIPFHEAYSYALDAFPMMVCLLLLAVIHPGRTLQGPGSSFSKSRKEKKAEKQAKKADKAARKAAKKGKKDKLGSGYVEMDQMTPGYSSEASLQQTRV